MNPSPNTIVRVLKRLKAAVGYQELGMTKQALHSLDSLASFGEIGRFGLVADVLRGEFTKCRENHVSAASALEIVGCMLSPPYRDAINMTLAACYGQGDSTRAANLASARGALPASQPKSAG